MRLATGTEKLPGPKVRKYIKYAQRSRARPLGRFQVGFGVDLADNYSGAQGERLFGRAPDMESINQVELNRVLPYRVEPY
jgi:hypothetical protein